MTKFACAVIALVLWSVPAGAQHLAHGASGLPHGIPDFCLEAGSLIVPSGEARTLSGSIDVPCLGIHGAVTVADGTKIRGQVLVYADGSLVVGAMEKPARDVTFVLPDRPLNTQTDPEQFGNGFIGLGRVWFYGVPTAGNVARSITIRSENPQGTRGHVLISQRADLILQYVDILEMGRTLAAVPINSTLIAPDSGEVVRIGTNQIGRYALHLHHVMGPLPGSGRPYQFQLVGNRIVGDSKWGIAAHNSHFGLLQDNVCVRSAGVCYVEEDGSETGNQWLGNYAGQPSSVKVCSVETYDPEGQCSAGFWLRGSNQVLRNNTVEGMQRGIGWWHGCLEMIGPPCGLDVKVTIPKFPGADTTDVNNIEICKGADGSTGACTVKNRKGLQADGNILRNTETGLDFWWVSRVQNGGPAITNTTFENVRVPLFMHYSDVQYDGITATGCVDFIQQFNDAHPIGFGAAESRVVHATATCTDSVYRRIGQLHQAPLWRITDSTLNVPNGVRLRYGGQRVVGYPEAVFAIERSTMSGQIFTIDPADPESLPEQKITYSAANVNGQTFTRVLPEGSTPTPPTLVLAVSSNVTQASPNGQPVAVTYQAPIASGGTPPLAASCSPVSGSLFTVGTTLVSCQASDAAGQKASASFSVTVTFTPTPPVDVCKTDPLTLTMTWPKQSTSQTRSQTNKPARVTTDMLVTPWKATAVDARGCVVTVTK